MCGHGPSDKFSPVARLGGLAPARPITSAMPRILGERERPHWLWPKSHMPCRVFYDSRSNTALFIGGQHGRCIAYDSPSKTHSVVVVSCGDVHTESGSAGVDNVQAQRRSVVERKPELEAVKSLLRTCDL